MSNRPVPTHLKIVRGNPGKRALNKREPQPVGPLDEAPDWLTEAQRAGWRYAIAHAPIGLLKHLDASVLTIWVVAEDMHREAAQKVAQHGMLIKSPVSGSPMQSPYLPIVNRQALIMLRAAAEMGFTPSSRSRIAVEESIGSSKYADLGG